MARKIYPKEFHDFMAAYIPGHSAEEISVKALEITGIEISPAKVKCYKANHKIQSGTRGGNYNSIFPQEVQLFIRDNCHDLSQEKLAQSIQEVFGISFTRGQIKAFIANHGVHSGRTGYFTKGHIPANKGKKMKSIPPRMAATQFTSGHIPANKMPIGSICRKSDGYLWQKIGQGSRDWRQLHVILWETENGPIPDGHCLIFLDGNRENVTLDNLRLISRGALAIINKKKLRSDIPQVTNAYASLAELKREIGKQNKRGGKNGIAARSGPGCSNSEQPKSKGLEESEYAMVPDRRETVHDDTNT